jgi:hypothetical protein
MMAGADRRFLAIDSSKFARRGLFRYATWDEFARVFTDDGVTADVRQWLAAVSPDVAYVPVPRERSKKLPDVGEVAMSPVPGRGRKV